MARALLGDRPDVAVILIGANDATAAAPARRGRRLPRRRRAPAARRRRRRWSSAPVPTWAPCRAIAPPLRQVVGLVRPAASARAQTGPCVAAGGAVVDLGAETGAVFRADAGTLCYDGFHPSADGYRVWAHALLPGGGGRGRRRPAAREPTSGFGGGLPAG